LDVLFNYIDGFHGGDAGNDGAFAGHCATFTTYFGVDVTATGLRRGFDPRVQIAPWTEAGCTNNYNNLINQLDARHVGYDAARLLAVGH